MKKVKYLGYDIYNLKYDLGPGELISTKTVKLNKKFKSDAGGLKHIALKILHTAYHKDDWFFERDCVEEYDNTWVLHIIVDKKTHKWANKKMINEWRDKTDNEGGKLELVDLLVNVRFEDVD